MNYISIPRCHSTPTTLHALSHCGSVSVSSPAAPLQTAVTMTPASSPMPFPNMLPFPTCCFLPTATILLPAAPPQHHSPLPHRDVPDHVAVTCNVVQCCPAAALPSTHCPWCRLLSCCHCASYFPVLRYHHPVATVSCPFAHQHPTASSSTPPSVNPCVYN